jgi:NAD(P)-dependent dehydrogenase (short-subunit alcohol dehydrogenase family)
VRTVQQLADLEGRVGLVVGAGHVGKVAFDALSELGAAVAVADSDGARAAAVIESASERGVTARSYTVDLADDDAVVALPGQVVDDLGRLDVLVLAAAYVGTTALEGWTTQFAEQSLATWRASLDVNLTSAFALVQAAAPALRDSGAASVVLLGSIYGVVGPDLRLYEDTTMGNPAAYAAAKGGLVQLCRWLATVLAPDVRVNLCSPGGLHRGQDDRFVAAYVDRTPLRRMGTEEDLKGAIAYLGSDLSSYVTGQNLLVDGGWTAW